MKSRSPYTDASPGSCTGALRRTRDTISFLPAAVPTTCSPRLRSRSMQVRVVRAPRPQTRAVRQEVPDVDLLLAALGERGQVGRDRRVELQPALGDEQHGRRRRRHHLGQRGQVVERVEPGLVALGHEHRRAERRVEGELLAQARQHHAAGQLARVDRLLERRARSSRACDSLRRASRVLLHYRLQPREQTSVSVQPRANPDTERAVVRDVAEREILDDRAVHGGG